WPGVVARVDWAYQLGQAIMMRGKPILNSVATLGQARGAGVPVADRRGWEIKHWAGEEANRCRKVEGETTTSPSSRRGAGMSASLGMICSR
ncbi:MAG: hypothetical protein VX509_07490, partial [Verrucomicrobiota bacterium]|nr:hypothetical protein [Verrucomicrobiota bacterium]